MDTILTIAAICRVVTGEDARRVADGEQVQHVAKLAMTNKPSVDFCGYWQRAQKEA